MAVIEFDTNILFADNIPFSYADIELLRKNALLLDALSLDGRRAYLDQVGYSNSHLDQAQGNPSQLSRGAFMFQTGLTTLTLSVYTVLPGNTHTLQVYLGSTLASSTTLSGGNQTITVTLTGRGYNNQDIIDVTVQVARNAGNTGYYALNDAYVSPASALTNIGTWVAPASFGTLNATNLNRLLNAQIWLFNRMNNCHLPVPMGMVFDPGFFWPVTTLLWSGSIARTNGCTHLRTSISYNNTNTGSEYLQLSIDGTVRATSAAITAGQYGTLTFDLDITAWTTADIPSAIKIEQVVTAAAAAGVSAVATRYTIYLVEVYNPSPSYAASPTVSTPLESITIDTLQSRLNAIGTLLTTIKSRIDAAPDRFDRIRLFRWQPVLDDFQRTFYHNVFQPSSWRRADGLWVKGRGLKIAFGPMQITHEKLGDLWQWSNAYEVDLVAGDAVETKYVQFDAYDGLWAGAPYFIRGDEIHYVAEVWQ